jgi:N-methylhydantoinase B
MDGVDSGGSYMSCPNVEWFELNFPILYLFRRHAVDSAGAGKFRGGVGVETAHTIHDAPENRLDGVAYGVAGLKNSGRGLFGGYPGAPSIIVMHQGTRLQEIVGTGKVPVEISGIGGQERFLPYCNFAMARGDVLYMRVASGGGYGDPQQRIPEQVRKDVMNGVVSRQTAREVYGVALTGADLTVDLDATRALREHSPPQGALMSRRPYRENLEIRTDTDGPSVCCTNCAHVLCRLDQDWRTAAKRTRFAPAKAGPLFGHLNGRYVFEKIYCPLCGAVFNSEMVGGDV